ncbi:MAG: tetratricopeptide repeat protein [Magnetococcales bacterium]|nr:tetratricopeptide repeat protein [Magnetococcales bacterium]
MMDKTDSVFPLLQKTIDLHQEGFYLQADFFTRQILKQLPEQGDFNHLLSFISQQLSLFTQIQIETTNKNQSHYYRSMATLCQNLGGLDEAISLFRLAIALNPNDPEIINHFGETLHEAGELEEALFCYKRAVEQKPDFAQAYNNLGNVVQGFKAYGQSVLYYKKAISLKKDYSEAYSNLGYVLRRQGYSDRAIPYYKESVRLDPFSGEGWLGLGRAYFDLGEMAKAERSFRKAIEAKPGFFQAYNALGHMLREFGDLGQATFSLMKAVDINPDYSAALINLGGAYRLLNRFDNAGRAYQQALQISPEDPAALASLSFLLQELCEWQELAEIKPRLDRQIQKLVDRGECSPEPLFNNITRHCDPPFNLAVARSRSHFIANKIHRPDPFHYEIDSGRSDPHTREGKIRIGYLSNGFESKNPLAYQAYGLFKHHDRSRFELFGYGYCKEDASPIRKKMIAELDHFVDIQEMSFTQAAEQIHDDKIDILIDLTGYCPGNRLEICALRPAPVQLSYLGFPGSSGSQFIDGIIADAITIPDEHLPFYSEKVLRLPHSYMVGRYPDEAAQQRLTRRGCGLPNEGTIFSSFNRPYQIDAALFADWMTILSAVPGSVLWLSPMPIPAQENLRRSAKRAKIDPGRLVFSQAPAYFTPQARYQLVDLALDTRRYNGQSSSCDALWAGVPLITQEGEHFASRVGSSILHAMELPELVAHSQEAYQTLAIELALNPEKLARLKKRVADRRLTTPLFDWNQHLKALEECLEGCWRDYLKKRAVAPKEY